MKQRNIYFLLCCLAFYITTYGTKENQPTSNISTEKKLSDFFEDTALTKKSAILNDKESPQIFSQLPINNDLPLIATNNNTVTHHSSYPGIGSHSVKEYRSKEAERDVSSYFIEKSVTIDESEKNSEASMQSNIINNQWNEYAKPWSIFSDEGALLLNFVNSDLVNVLKYFETMFKVVFITDDALQPATIGGKSLMGSRINFSSNKPLSRKEAWNLLITLLELAGVTLQPGAVERVYRVVSLNKDSPQGYTRGPLPIYVGTKAIDLPEDIANMRIRFLYIVKNTSLEAVKSIVATMQSAASPMPIEIKEINGILITDRIYNIKTIMTIVEEIDKVTAPELMSIIKLKKAEATKIAELYKAIIKEETGGVASARIAGGKRTDFVSYFDPSLRIIPEPRTNSLILLGAKASIEKIEKFVKDYEMQSSNPYMPVHTYQLRFTQAESIASILQSAIGFKSDSDAGKTSGVRDGEKYLSNVTITPEPSTNVLIIAAPDEEYSYIYELLKKIDVEQPQVALDIILLSVDINSAKALGTQIRNIDGGLGKNINVQTGVFTPSGGGVVPGYTTDANGNILDGTTRLLSNLMQLILPGSPGAAGNTTVMTLGTDAYGVWGIVRMLQTYTNTKLVSNPFTITTNKYPTSINIGEVRRISATTITNSNNVQNSFTSDTAQIQIKIVPQISTDGMITLVIELENSSFTSPSGNGIEAGNKKIQSVKTSVLVPNKQVVALGGLMYQVDSDQQKEVPWFCKIPLIGWLFKSKEVVRSKSALLIFIQPSIVYSDTIKAEADKMSARFSEQMRTEQSFDSYCPVSRWFFSDSDISKSITDNFDNFVGEQIRVA